jgi:hypothetical protein
MTNQKLTRCDRVSSDRLDKIILKLNLIEHDYEILIQMLLNMNMNMNMTMLNSLFVKFNHPFLISQLLVSGW